MPLVQLTDSCSFHPETSAQFFESDPKQLLDLAKIMSDEKTLARTSKVQETSVLWVSQNKLDFLTVRLKTIFNILFLIVFQFIYIKHFFTIT